MNLNGKLIYRGTPERWDLYRYQGEDPTYLLRFHVTTLNGTQVPAEGDLEFTIRSLDGKDIVRKGIKIDDVLYRFELNNDDFRSRQIVDHRLFLVADGRRSLVAQGQITQQ